MTHLCVEEVPCATQYEVEQVRVITRLYEKEPVILVVEHSQSGS